jgi:hypothetical protein
MIVILLIQMDFIKKKKKINFMKIAKNASIKIKKIINCNKLGNNFE